MTDDLALARKLWSDLPFQVGLALRLQSATLAPAGDDPRHQLIAAMLDALVEEVKAKRDHLAVRALLQAVWPLRRVVLGDHAVARDVNGAVYLAAVCMRLRGPAAPARAQALAPAVTERGDRLILQGERERLCDWATSDFARAGERMDDELGWMTVTRMIAQGENHSVALDASIIARSRRTSGSHPASGQPGSGVPSGSLRRLDGSGMVHSGGNIQMTFGNGRIASLVNGRLSLIV